MNIDSEDAIAKVKDDFGTFKDPNFNELVQNMYSDLGRSLVEKTDILDVIAKRLGLKVTKEEGEGEFGGF